MIKKWPLPNESATQTLASRLANLVHPGDVITLEGDLGAGKTSFARAFIRALANADEEVPSPTFTILQLYECNIGTIWHFDLYRLQDSMELIELGVEDAFSDGISLIEWPNRLGSWMPAERLAITLQITSETERLVILHPSPGWSERIRRLRDE